MPTEQPSTGDNYTDRFLAAIEKSRVTYNRPPDYSAGLLAYPVYLQNMPLFERMVNDHDLADGTGFLQMVREAGLKISNVRFINWGERDSHSSALRIKPSSYVFSSSSNSVELTDLGGKTYRINISQYGVSYPSETPDDDGIDMRASGLDQLDLTVEFSLRLPSSTTGIDVDNIIQIAPPASVETSKKPGVHFGGVEIPADWQVDAQGKYANTTKAEALQFFNDQDWTPLILQQAATKISTGARSPIFFVTGGWTSYFWDSAKNVTVQPITSAEQLRKEFSGDVPEGKFFMKKSPLA